MEGRRVGNSIICDEIHIVSDDQAQTVVASGDVYKSLLQGANHDEDRMTSGSATGSGDVFDLKDHGSTQFQLFRGAVSKGRVRIVLKPNQPKPKPPVVNSAKVKITLR